jgi:Fungal tRNA ligase phosphodiesterase domain
MDPLAPTVAQKFVAASVTYTGVFLDEASHHALLEWWKKHTDAPILPKIWAHHMTMKFKPTPEELEATPLGEKVKLRVIGWAADEKGQAVLVEPEGVASANAHPHITIATAPGTGPVYSNDLLAKGVNHMAGPTLHGVVSAG